jgi:formate--tetrahydrofolate ligase
MSDIEIARAARLKPVMEIAREQFGIPAESMDPYGHYKAKLSLEHIESLATQEDGKLILVTAMPPWV